MTRRFPPAQALHAFDVAARHMSFTEAARELGITQAAVSQRIRLLEHQLGQQLFIRHARGLELTEAGRAFVPASHEAFDRLASGLAEAFGPVRDAPLTIRTTPGFAAHWLPRRLPRFQAARPELTLRLATAVWPGDFDLSGVDLEVRYGQGGWDGVEELRLTREHMTPVCSPAMAREITAIEDIGRFTLLHAIGFDTGWPQWLGEAGVPGLGDQATALLCDTLTTVLALAVEGCGMAMGRSGLADPMLASGALVAPFPLRIDTDESFFAVRAAGKQPRPEAAELWHWLAAEAAA